MAGRRARYLLGTAAAILIAVLLLRPEARNPGHRDNARQHDADGAGRLASRSEDDSHERPGRHDKERKLHEAIRALDQKLDALEISRVVDQSEGLRRVKASPFIRERYQLGEDVEFCEQQVVSKVIRRPSAGEEAEIRELVDSGLAAIDGLTAEAAGELRQKILSRHLDYEKGYMIVEKAAWKKPVLARDYIIHFHTNKAKRWNQQEGHTFGPDDESAPGDRSGGREGLIRRFGHLFKRE